MSDTTSEQSTDQTADEQGNPDEATLGDAGKQALDRMKAERNEAKQAAAALQKQLDEINAANLSDLEKAQKAAKDAQEAAAQAASEALRLRVAAKHGISDEDADLFLTGTDVETLERQAARLVERTPTGPKPDPSQGAKGSDSKATTAEQFAAAVEGAFTR